MGARLPLLRGVERSGPNGVGAGRTKPTPPDDRNWSRFPCAITAVYQVIPDEDDVRREAKVLNISAGGVALVAEHDVQAGALLSAELHAPAGQTVVTILACVVHVVVQSEHERILGCNFIQELSDNDLKALTQSPFSRDPKGSASATRSPSGRS